MSRLVRKFGFVIAAALALALVPGSAWGQSNSPAKGATGKTGAQKPQPGTNEVLKKAEQMRTEGGRHAADVNAQRKEEQQGKQDAAQSGQPTGETKKPAVSPGGPIVEKGDPFAVPIKPAPTAATAAKDLPPGQAGLLVSQAILQGIVKIPGGNRAVIHGPNDRTYFMKVNDKIYDARVTKITDDTVYFEETSMDPLGKITKREVAKSLPSEKKP